MAMVRYQMFIDESQKRMLEEMRRRLNVPVAELVRKAIDRLVADQAAGVAYHLTGDGIVADHFSSHAIVSSLTRIT